MSLINFRVRLMIEGVMPERALLRLKRAKIDVYDVKKVEKNQILLSVSRKDCEKVFAFYPNLCYNNTVYTPYTAKKIGGTGLYAFVEKCKKRVGLVLGGVLALAVLLASNSLVLGVRFVGEQSYKREGYAALAEAGVKPWSFYKAGNEDWVCANLLRLDGVEYCSVKKEGLYVVVEMRAREEQAPQKQKGCMQANHDGTLLKLTALKGFAVKQIGDKISVGDTLVDNSYYDATGGQVFIETVARAEIECVFSEEIEAENKEEAFAQAYLALALGEHDEIVEKNVDEIAAGRFHVKIRYVAIERMNL